MVFWRFGTLPYIDVVSSSLLIDRLRSSGVLTSSFSPNLLLINTTTALPTALRPYITSISLLNAIESIVGVVFVGQAR
jgi:hypothetical protein